MMPTKRIESRGTFLMVMVLASWPAYLLAQSPSSAAKPAPEVAAERREGQHDFDWEIGPWKTHIARRLHPLTGSNTWVEYDGTSVVRKVWDGRAQIEEFETDSPTSGHIEGLTLRTYNP